MPCSVERAVRSVESKPDFCHRLLNAQIVLIIEDVERTGGAFDTRHLQRLLWALRDVPRVSFVLAVDPGDAPDSSHSRLDFSKLCDSIELMQPLSYEQVAPIIDLAFAHWTSTYSYIDPHPDRRGGRLDLSYVRVGGAFEYARRASRDTPIDYVVSLLQTPRALKHVLRRVDRVWRDVHGEVDVDDVFVLAVLRQSAQPEYDFLLSHIDAARAEPSEFLPRTMTITDDWAQLLNAQPNRLAAQRLVDLLGIARLSDSPPQNVAAAPQGVRHAEPADYFRRIVAEQLDPDGVRDQVVLQDMEAWRKDHASAMVDRLVEATANTTKYVEIWEHFTFRCSEEDLVELTSTVAQRVLERDGREAAADHPALLALWRRCNRRLPQDRYAEWLLNIITSAMAVSLHFSNGVYYYWTGENGIVGDEQRARIRAAVENSLRETIRSGADLASRLNRKYPWDVGHFITQGGSEIAVFESWRGHLGPILAEGAEVAPEVILPEVANLIAADSSTMTAAGTEPPRFVNPYEIDRDRAAAVHGDLLDVILERIAAYDGTDVYTLRAREEAARWLAERRESVG